MYIGRNDPCPCGSGKEYQNCCLAKDEGEAQINELNQSAPSATPPDAEVDYEIPDVPPVPYDPRAEAWEARWQEFRLSNYESRIDLFTRTLDEPELMDEELAHEMLNELFSQAEARNQRDRFDELTETLRTKLPEVYEKNVKWMIDWRINNAITQGRHDIIPSFINDLGRLPGLDIDLWNRVESRLAYYGHLTTMLEAMRLGWPNVTASTEVEPWGIDEFSYRAVQYEILNYILQTPAPDGYDPVLHEKIEHYYGKDYFRDNIAEEIDILAGRLSRQWTLTDFNLPLTENEEDEEWEDSNGLDGDELDDEDDDDDNDFETLDDDDDDDDDEDEDDDDEEEWEYQSPHPAEANLRDLTYQFVWYAHKLEGVSYAKAEMTRVDLRSFILERHEGNFDYRDKLYDAMISNDGMNSKPLKKYQPYKNLLVPDRERFEKYMVNMFQIWSPQPYRAAALMELVPVWLRFLQSQGLIDGEFRKRTVQELKPLADDLLKIYRRGYHDQNLCDAMERWKWDAGKEPV